MTGKHKLSWVTDGMASLKFIIHFNDYCYLLLLLLSFLIYDRWSGTTGFDESSLHIMPGIT